MIHFISFADNKFLKSLDRIKNESINSNFFDCVNVFQESDLIEEDLNYCHNNKRGFGYWVWKPIIVLKYLQEVNYGDIIVYADAGCTINKEGNNHFNNYINYLSKNSNDCIFFQTPHAEKLYSKMNLIKFLNAENLIDTGQVAACSFFLKKTERTVELIEQWKDICKNNKHFIDDSESTIVNDAAFIDHRHDQSVLSILVKKRNISLFEDDTYKFKSHNDSTYPINCTRIKY